MASILSRFVEVCVFKFENNNPQYLLFRRSKGEKVYPGIWQVITGAIEEGETALSAAQRELAEETALNPISFWCLPQVSSFYDPGTDAIHICPVFAAQVKPGDASRLSPEHCEARWLSLGEALRLLAWPAQRAALRILDEEIVCGGPASSLTRIPSPPLTRLSTGHPEAGSKG